MNKIIKNKKGDDIYFGKHVAHSIKRGDVLLRPIIAQHWFDRLINRLMPGDYEHAMLYVGDGVVLNPYPDKKGYIHREDIFANLRWYKRFIRNPKLVTFVRLSEDERVVEHAIAHFQRRKQSSYLQSYCTRAIMESFIQAGVPKEKFQAGRRRISLVSFIIVRLFDTGYEISLAAVRQTRFEKACADGNHVSK